MPFLHGLVTYSRFAVTGDAPTAIDQAVLDAFAANPARPTPIGVPSGPEAGWTAGRHLLDEGFAFESMCFDGWIHAAMRLDVVRVPPEVRRAYIAIAEGSRVKALDNAVPGWLSRTARKEAREEARRQWDEEVAKGRYRTSKLVPILWNPAQRVLFAPAASDTVIAPLRDLFAATFGGRLEPRSAGSIAMDMLAERGLMSAFEDARIEPLSAAPRGATSERPEVPWATGGPEPKDFLGNVFLTWLWWRCETTEGLVDCGDLGTIEIAIDRTLETECAWGVAGRQLLSGDHPVSWPEASAAARSGKWPRRIGLLLVHEEQDWRLSFQGDRFSISGLRLPKSEVPAESQLEQECRRIEAIAGLDRSLLGLYDAFLQDRFGPTWSATRSQIIEWQQARGGARQPAPEPKPAAIADVPEVFQEQA